MGPWIDLSQLKIATKKHLYMIRKFEGKYDETPR